MKSRADEKAEVRFPRGILSPIQGFLKGEVKRLKLMKRGIERGDPFRDESRTMNNSVEEDVDEQVGHMDVQIKAKFLAKQIVQLRKALTRMKLGKYGICELCGQMIDTDRLAVSPEVTVCVKCEKEREK